MIIDKDNPGHSHIPPTLHGEVLLEETKDPQGNTTGFLTATQQAVADYKNATPQERIDAGWDKHIAILDSLNLQDLPTPKPIPPIVPHQP